MTEQPRLAPLTPGQVLRSLLVLLAVAALLVLGLPWLAGVTWPEIAARVRRVGPGGIVLLLALKALALLSYTVFYRGSLPGLTVRQALVINVSGTAVSQLAPAGGAIGVGATWLQGRSWGLARHAIAASVVVTAVWNLAARLALPALGLLVLLASGGDVPVSVMATVASATGVGLVLLGAVLLLAVNAGASHGVARPVLWVAGRMRPSLRELGAAERAARVDRYRRVLLGVVRQGWGRMTAGLAGWFAAYFLLFWACLHLSGAGLPWPQLFAAYAVGRLLTAAAVTPGGIGITEAGMLGMLTALGADPAAATAGVLLFSVFYQLIEVPLGALAWGAWWLGPRPGDAAR